MTDFEQIYRDYFRDVFLYVRRLSGGDERLSEDITGEAFFRALKRIDTFRGDCDIRVLLYPPETEPQDGTHGRYWAAYRNRGIAG